MLYLIQGVAMHPKMRKHFLEGADIGDVLSMAHDEEGGNHGTAGK
jgi:hypothetical protein